MKDFTAIYKMWDALHGTADPCQVRCTKVVSKNGDVTYVVIVSRPEVTEVDRKYIAATGSLEQSLTEVTQQMKQAVEGQIAELTELVRTCTRRDDV